MSAAPSHHRKWSYSGHKANDTYIPNANVLVLAAHARNEVPYADEDPGAVWAAVDIMDEDVATIAVQLVQSIPTLLVP